MSKKLEQYVKENGLRKTARLFGRSTQWVIDRYEYKAVFIKGKLDHVDGPPKSERCFVLLERDQDK